jgi:VanZ family protein
LERAATIRWKPDRVLLSIYLITLFGLLMAPINGPKYSLLGIEIDKWIHVALFGGLAVFLRWNLSTTRHAAVLSVGIASVIAGVTEIAQGLVGYRSADLLDLFAGVLGITLGTISTNRILASSVPDKLIGIVVAMFGAMISAIFLLADLIGVSENSVFGAVQLAGTVLGALIGVGGIRIYVKAATIDLRS